MTLIKKIFSGALLVSVFVVTLSFGAGEANAATTADWIGAGAGLILNGINKSEQENQAREAQKANQQKLNEQKRGQVRDYIFNKIVTMKGFIKDNQEKQMWEGLAKQLQESYKAFPKTEQTTTKTVMSITDREEGVDITETIVYDKAANLITITVEHKPGFKEEMSDKAK